VPPYEIYELDLDFDKLISEALMIERETFDRIHISNMNGGIQIHKPAWEKIFPDLYIQKNMDPMLKNIILEKLNTDVNIQLWLNINYPGSYNAPHKHKGAFGSGVFYVKTPKGSGNLIFPSINKEIKPKPGMMVLFDPHVLHGVAPNFSDDVRISFAFNYYKK